MCRVAAANIGVTDRTSAKDVLLPCPVLTRWWTVGVAAEFVLQNWGLVVAVAEGVIRRDLPDKASNQIASSAQALLKKPQVRSDIYLIAAYHKYFLFSHFAWLQKGNPFIGEKAGFLSRHIAGRYFLMQSELVVALKDDVWKEMVDF